MVAFRLVLDTRAPRVAWGAVAGTSAGELLRVAYTVDEPELTAATLRLPDGRELVASVLADRIELYLPPDTPSGAATLVAHVVDDLGNQADVEYTIVLSAAVAGIPTGPRRSSHPTWSPPLPPEPTRLVAWARSSAGARSRDRVTNVTSPRSGRVRVSSSTGVARRALVVRSRAVSSSATRVDVVHLAAPAVAGTATEGRLVRRCDGPGIEEALLLDVL